MKQLILIFFAIFSTLSAKSIELPFEVKYCKHDTVFSYLIDNVSNVKTLSQIFVNEYNANGLLEKVVIYDYIGGNYKIKVEDSYSYDAASNITKHEHFYYDNLIKIPFNKLEYAYNINNQVTAVTASNYDLGVNDYVFSYRVLSIYANNKINHTISESYNSVSMSWYKVYKVDHEYYANDSLYELILSYYDNASSAWKYENKTQHVYNTNNIKTSIVHMNFSNTINDWYETMVAEYKYDGAQQLRAINYIDYGIPKLLKVDSFSYTGDNITKYSFYETDVNDSLNYRKEIAISYNDKNEVTDVIELREYDKAISLFTKGAQKTYNCIIEEDVSVVSINNDNVTIYPNPLLPGQSLNINHIQTPATAHVYNATGVLIQSFTLQKGNNQIPTNDLSAGLYLLKIDNAIHKFIMY